ncbi:MAG: T9SS type A sorting domain-containing protein [Elusimicrobia bacterium]|nr:T9SS type A sorting domain-containing protein [Elusimicrobiota bacterium]
MLGLARLRALALVFAACAEAALPSRPQGFSFTSASGRFVTPTTPVTFSFSNPRDSSGSIRIYDLRGREVTTLDIVSGNTSKQWNGRAGGALVTMGVYIYVISVEDVVYSGTVVVLR